MNYPCDRFAAFLAHCLNSEDSPWVQLSLGELYARLTEALAARYAEPLLHHPGYAWRMSPEEASARYFDISLGRALLLSPRVQLSIAHRFLQALCERGAEAVWRQVVVVRTKDQAETAAQVVPLGAQRSFEQCRQRLAKLPQTISAGSPSPTIRARHGAIVLRLYSLEAAVPEEISMWDAVSCAPATLYPLPAGEPFNRFCCLVIDCVRTAHRPFQELLGLGRGLCPFDWLDVLSIQQTRALRRFLRVLEEADAADTPEHWERAWQQEPVAGFATADKLWQSDIGIALRQPQGRSRIDTALLESLADSESEAQGIPAYLAEQELLSVLDALLAREFINAAERSLLLDLHKGVSATEVTQSLVEDLLKRIEIGASQLHREHAS
jgi:hypothetical protein